MGFTYSDMRTRGKEAKYMTVKGKELVRHERPTYLSPFEDMERLFEKAWHSPLSIMRSMWPTAVSEHETLLPRVDMYEEGSELVLKADLPGYKKEDVDIHLSGNILTISGETKTEEKVEKGDYYTYERSQGSFYRRFEIPIDIDTKKTKARLENGVLEIRLPKTHEVESKSRKIEITS